MGKILALTDADRERIFGEFPYLDPDVGDINININNIHKIDSPFEDIFNNGGDLRYAIMDILSNPHNIWLTVKLLLGISLEPMQVVILSQLWNKSYPMLCATRGGGKCTTADTWIVKNNGFDRIGNIINKEVPDLTPDYKTDLQLLGENGFNSAEYSFSNGKTPTVKIETSNGYPLEGTEDHPIRIVRDGKIEWVQMKDLKLGDYAPIHRGTEWFPDTNDITVDEGYLMGLLVGDGGYTVRGRISFTTADQPLLDEVNRISSNLWNKSFKYASGYSYNLYGVSIWDELFQKYGFNSSVCGEKDFPSSILSSKKEVVAAFIRGLADTDGTCLHNGVQFASKSEQLMRSLQFILTRFGIISNLKPRYNKKYDRWYWYLKITGESNRVFSEQIGFGLKRKQDKLNVICSKVGNPNKDLIPDELVQSQIISLRDKFAKLGPIGDRNYSYNRNLLSPWRIKKYGCGYKTLQKILELTKELNGEPEWIYLSNILDKNYFYDRITKLEQSENYTYDVHIPNDHSFISNGFISHNTFLMAIYIVLRCVFTPGSQVVIVGFGLRQAKNVFDYVDKIWKGAPLLREMLKEYPEKDKGPKQAVDRYLFLFGDSSAMFLPLGSGATIRGIRAQYIIIDEYGDVPKTIIDTVVKGFAAVSGSPIEKRNLIAHIKRMKNQGKWDNNKEREAMAILKSNQIVLAGTAKFHFNHFAQDWIRYREIIRAAGNTELLMKICNEEDPAKLPNPNEYAIIRIPYQLYPEGIMDTSTIHNIKGSTSKAVFQQEYETVFTDDSDGFFKAKLLHECTANDAIEWGGIKITDAFDPYLRANPGKKYVLGFDPAAKIDNAAIVILELNDTHAKVVYCWTINQKEYEKEIMEFVGGMTYLKFLAWKIAKLHRIFNFSVMSFDAQQGGESVAELLAREADVRPSGMPPIYPIRDGHILWDGTDRPSDDMEGEHIIELVQFANAKWNHEAHYGLRTDLEQRRVIFPRFDALSVDIDGEGIDHLNESTADISTQIEELKYELTILEHTVTPGGNRERWDTPEVKDEHDKKGRLRNDRASALILANMAARRIRLAYPEIDYFSEFTNKPRKQDGAWKTAPGWFKDKYGGGVGVFKIL